MLNKAILIGNLGADPELKYIQSGTPVTTLSLATSETWKDNDGNKQESTEWHRVVVWKRLAELCCEYLKKGSRVYLEGKIQTRQWEKDGEKRYTTEIVAREVKFLSPVQSPESQGQGFGGDQGDGFGVPPSDDVPF